MVKVRNTTLCIHSGSGITIALPLETYLPKEKRDRKLHVLWKDWQVKFWRIPSYPLSCWELLWDGSNSWIFFLLFICTCFTGIKEREKNPIMASNKRLLGLHIVAGIIIASAHHKIPSLFVEAYDQKPKNITWKHPGQHEEVEIACLIS